ncbi:MAG: roadblock/LC7 domain-containing protein [Hamadaea sp.]|uniref:roadblock/LC7 domain-containing protein n=1 Tax=Hamadaea sp. NPDC050747 TaxID=3155789 RepID=UPI0017AF10F3|nr:roadblock/LC7 domain-containing protein [Hamadaea sp.]NUR48378.1 roadblock/LC7 domain-containing protein [Hamadaea sp.]
MTSTSDTAAPSGLGWLLDDLVGKVPAARHAVLLSVDGLVLGRDAKFTADEADHLAAASAGLASLARGAGRRFEGGAVRSTVVEFDTAYLLIADAGNRTCLAVLTGADTDLGLLAYEAELMVTRVGEHLATGAR